MPRSPPHPTVRRSRRSREHDAATPAGETTWFVVERIIGDQVLLEFECIPTVFGNACPNGTQTSMPLAQARARLNNHTRETDNEFMRGLRLFAIESHHFVRPIGGLMWRPHTHGRKIR
jgi:hypothetical protein